MIPDTSQIDFSGSVLIVEDSSHYAVVLERLLTRGLGFKEVTMCADTTTAYEKIAAAPTQYRLLFVDFHYPDGDNGASFLKRLQDAGLLNGKIALIITSDPSFENAKAAQDAGAFGLVAKPFDAHQLRMQIEKAQRAFYADSIQFFEG
jgi:DNA-binding NtrC family response regulator